MERLLTEVVERLQKAHGTRLVSVVLYGSGAASEGRDTMSDYNILCVLTKVTPDELREAEPVFRWWREMKNPSPLLLSIEEVRTSVDSFPMEFHDIRERHVVLAGEDLFRDLIIDPSYYRAHVEHELRSKLIRLRQKAGGVLSDNSLLLTLMLESVSTFCVLFRHALWIAGDVPHFGKREVVAAAKERFGIATDTFDTLLDLREGKQKARAVSDSPALFASYLAAVSSVIDQIDRM
ncbi:MAG: hypothetical protein H7039_02475 [Bryobacteraceae bacterium]|nr:hypothetical protein [Bryobacteraceae bacterium]